MKPLNSQCFGANRLPGRRKGIRNLMTDVKRTLKVPLKVKEGGHSRRMSTQEGALMLLREKALKGDARALDRLADQLVPFVDRNLAGDDCRSPTVAFFEDFEEVVAGGGIERLKTPIIED